VDGLREGVGARAQETMRLAIRQNTREFLIGVFIVPQEIGVSYNLPSRRWIDTTLKN
jgi:hypothetical protein